MCRARFTFRPLKLHGSEFVVVAVVAHRPRHAGVSLRTGDGAVFPFNDESVNLVAGCLLPGVFFPYRTEQAHTIITLAVEQQRRGDVAPRI